jgi:two-component system, OmpR family, response regulator QseB
MNRILITEAEPQITTFLQRGLRGNGFIATAVNSRCERFLLSSIENFDLLLLDLDLFCNDGLMILEKLRRQGKTLPIIVLTARNSMPDKVAGLEKGANDYIVKPFHFEELLARMHVWLRKGCVQNSAEEGILRVSNIRLNLRTRQVWVKECPVNLSTREFNLARILLHYPGQVMSREKLINCVWGDDYDSGSNIVDVYIGHLRRKLGTDLIKTMKGVGYYLQV